MLQKIISWIFSPVPVKPVIFDFTLSKVDIDKEFKKFKRQLKGVVKK